MLSFKALGYSSLKEWIPQNVPMIQITNTNQNKVDINISFSTVRRENAKEIIKWIADKGVDVGIALLPLLLQIK